MVQQHEPTPCKTGSRTRLDPPKGVLPHCATVVHLRGVHTGRHPDIVRPFLFEARARPRLRLAATRISQKEISPHRDVTTRVFTSAHAFAARGASGRPRGASGPARRYSSELGSDQAFRNINGRQWKLKVVQETSFPEISAEIKPSQRHFGKRKGGYKRRTPEKAAEKAKSGGRLKNLFGEQQMLAFANYVQAAFMLNYNKRNVG